jgi:branched chain amino acid aminotransferase apoenzyme (EC 2.6.1.42)
MKDKKTAGKKNGSPFEGSKVWMDGKFLDYKDAKVSVNSHSLHYGLGAFEGIRCYETKRRFRNIQVGRTYRQTFTTPAIFFNCLFHMKRRKLKRLL